MLNELDDLVRNGTFDRSLVRPLDPLIQVLTRRFGVNTVGDVITAVGLLVFATAIADLRWTPLHVLYAGAAAPARARHDRPRRPRLPARTQSVVGRARQACPRASRRPRAPTS